MGLAGDGKSTGGEVPAEAGANARRILIVEDETLIALYLVELLADLNYDVSGPAASAARAMRIAEDRRPDLALIDIGLAGRADGIQIAHDLRDRFGVPTIFLSGTSDPATIHRARSAAPVDFIHKPFAADQLEAALKGAFAGA